MGLICDVEEVHAALGDMLPAIQQSKYYQSAKGHVFLAEYSAAQAEGPMQAARALVLRQASRRFGTLPEGAAAALNGITAMERLEPLAERVLTARDWPSLLATA